MSQGATLLHLRGAAGMDAIYRKICWRLLPLLVLCCAVAWLDRVNVDLVARHIGASAAVRDHVHSWGMAAFFLGCCAFAIPGSLLFDRLGTRKMLLCLMLSWAVLSAASAFVPTPPVFYLLRFLLGACEAGFFPGMILYLTCWFPSGRRARAIAVFAAGAVAAAMLAAPLSAAILKTLAPMATVAPMTSSASPGPFAGWQWLLLAQAALPLLLGVYAWCYLDDSPDDAGWLTSFEQQMVGQDLARDEAQRHGGSAKDVDDRPAPPALAVLWGLLCSRTIVLLGAANLLLICAGFAIVHWAPAMLLRWSAGAAVQLTQSTPAAPPVYLGRMVQMVHIGQPGQSPPSTQPALPSAVPDAAGLASTAGADGSVSMLTMVGIVCLAGVVGMVAIGHDSDRRRERRGHFVASTVLAAGGLGLAIAADGMLAWSLAGLALATIGLAAAAPLLQAIVTDLLTRAQMATGVALVTSMGVLGAALGPALAVRLLAWGDAAALLATLVGACLAAGLLLLLALRLAPRRGGPASHSGQPDKLTRTSERH
ncbi:MFS transporter [Duganella sp. Leaf126]|uniref:MFS transporter n=1 Tax=Duganella sp. Leaf126 TaxID=1736266 RepID=UPI0006FE610D|nr:MFS transporter [Duganella sp. Leaf126]KQQ32939.1 MFS transporter [Duganella sp. Leaf126]